MSEEIDKEVIEMWRVTTRGKVGAARVDTAPKLGLFAVSGTRQEVSDLLIGLEMRGAVRPYEELHMQRVEHFVSPQAVRDEIARNVEKAMNDEIHKIALRDTILSRRFPL